MPSWLMAECRNASTFTLKNLRFRERKFYIWNFCSREWKYLGTFAAGSKKVMELSLQNVRTHAVTDISIIDLISLGRHVDGHNCAYIMLPCCIISCRQYQRCIVCQWPLILTLFDSCFQCLCLEVTRNEAFAAAKSSSYVGLWTWGMYGVTCETCSSGCMNTCDTILAHVWGNAFCC